MLPSHFKVNHFLQKFQGNEINAGYIQEIQDHTHNLFP